MTSAYQPKVGRIPIRLLSPRQPTELWPAKAVVGDVVPFRASVFKDGHDVLGTELLLTDPSGSTSTHRMRPGSSGTDEWQVDVQLTGSGTWRFSVRGWSDDWLTWLAAARIKIPAGVDIELTLATGEQLLRRAASEQPNSRSITTAILRLADSALTPKERLAAATDDTLAVELNNRPLTSYTTLSPRQPLRVERTRAGVGSWYEFFPRSEGAKRNKDGSWTSGTFRTASRRLPAVARMGFDVVYLPPIHPIGTSFRKGPNNTLNAGKNDPGSPWAIGSADGGHDAIHPDLGTVDDFTAFLAAAKTNKLEVAIDLALQCSPDHPWVQEHPEWFTTLPDGSIAYAENPPKKYQDIYPLNFDNDFPGLRTEVLRIVNYWIDLGVKIFRVDNPHTKPLRFWEWLLHEVAGEHPDVVFLAEAFTRPAMMQALAQVGFQQSYTYFTWRNTKTELEEYLAELSHDSSAYLRPNLFVNTPDILTEYLQFGGVPAYRIRAAIAATGAPTWGVYSGYELIENVARPGSEENIDNEKYEYRPRNWAKAEKDGRSIAGYIATLNQIRRQHPALLQLRNLTVHASDDDSILVYSKFLDGKFTQSGQDDVIIVVANVDPHSVRETTTHLDLAALGFGDDETSHDPAGSHAATRFDVIDLVTGQLFNWGADNYVRLDAFNQPVHILHVQTPIPEES